MRLFRYYNESDYALRSWRLNNEIKENSLTETSAYRYFDGDNDPNTYHPSDGDMFFFGVSGPLGLPVSNPEIFELPDDTYRIFSFCARSRSPALGAVGTAVNGMESEIDLQTIGFDWQHYSHSKEFRSNIVDEKKYWEKVADDFGLTVEHPRN